MEMSRHARSGPWSEAMAQKAEAKTGGRFIDPVRRRGTLRSERRDPNPPPSGMAPREAEEKTKAKADDAMHKKARSPPKAQTARNHNSCISSVIIPTETRKGPN
mmetsp:Transcript_37503/g.69110  ORF Transcript_37503/g.69110 Transcript_37503/m.69110 type:complete len:104 (-) Transcript_37503:1464-1775(-)